MSTTNAEASRPPVRQHQVANPVEYEKSVYQNGLRYERPPFTFRSQDWESQAGSFMSANSAGYVIGNAGTGETAKKNIEAFRKWSIVPSRLVKSESLPDLSTKVVGHEFQFPIAAAPVGVQRMSTLRSTSSLFRYWAFADDISRNFQPRWRSCCS